jgi:PTS system nitrogen regulatory IIA component
MQLTVRDLTEMFKVSETAVTRWVRQQKLPAQRVDGQFRFNRLEVLDWALANQMKMENAEGDIRSDVAALPSLADALQVGGIHYDVAGEGREAVLGTMVSLLPLPNDFDRELLARLFLARGAFGAMTPGDGIVIPHARRPIVLHVPRTVVTLFFLKQPVVGLGGDGLAVRSCFSIISPTVAAHIQALARLSRSLADPAFRKCVVARKPREMILREARRIEKAEQMAQARPPQAA